MTRIPKAVLALLLAGAGSAGAQAVPDSLPPTVTAAMVAKGRELFVGPGLCVACHGFDGTGAIGPDLTDTMWLHPDGSYLALVARIIHGVPDSESVSGTAMPPKGGSALTDDEVRSVAAYVWSLSRPPSGRR